MTAAIASVTEASTHRCEPGDPLYTCFEGSRLDDCFVDDGLCGGTRSTEPGTAAEAGLEDPASTEPLEPLLRFPTDRFAEVIHPVVAEVYDWFWRWRDSPLGGSHAHEGIEVGGGIKVNGQPREFTLSVRQQDEAQLHLLWIESIGRVALTVHAAPDGRHIVEFDTYPEGPERGRSGFLRVEPQ
jgi:hypothetical protein